MDGQLRVSVGLALLALLVHICMNSTVHQGDATRVPLVQLGSVSTSSIALWLLSANATSVRVRYDDTSQQVLQSLRLDSPATVWLEGLAPATTYRLHVELVDETRNVVYTNDITASTLSTDVSAPLSFAFGSCTMVIPFLYDLVGFGGNLDYIASVLSPAFMLLLGDQVYADVDLQPRGTDALYRATVQDPSYEALTQSTPIFSMYDDHEIYNNWYQGEDDVLYTERVGLFHQYFGQRNPRPLQDGDHYFAWQAGAASFFMLDVRKYASPKAMVDGPTKTKLGAVQKSHLLNWLLAAETPFKFIVSPMVVSSLGLHSTDEGWALYQTEYHEIFDAVAAHNISGVVVLSGDLHWAGFFQHGAYPFLFEMGASPIAAMPVPPFVPRWLLHSTDTLHFGSFSGTHFGHVDVSSTSLRMTIYRARLGWPQPVFTRELLWTETIPAPAT